LHDEEPKGISGLFNEAIADVSIGIGPRTCGKVRERALKPPSQPAES
jgi:hypothetical protein